MTTTNTTSNSVPIKLSGKLSASNGGELRSLLSDAYASNPNQLVLDVDELQFIDSTGLGILAGFLQKMRANEGQMVLLNPKPEIKALLELTRLDQFFVIKETNA